MMSLTDQQLKAVTDAARAVPVEKRDVFLQRIAAMLKFRGRSDDDIADAVKLALSGLTHQPAA
jgi:Holliday junction resolvasome RuvABC endonuclease subunit